MTELMPYQARIPAHLVHVDDFLDEIEPARMRGPRGGRYRFDGVTVQSRVLEVLRRDDETVIGYRTTARTIKFNSNVLHLTTAIVRVPEYKQS